MILLTQPDCFIVTQNSRPMPGTGAIKTTHCETTTLCYLPVPITPNSYRDGMAKNIVSHL